MSEAAATKKTLRPQSVLAASEKLLLKGICDMLAIRVLIRGWWFDVVDSQVEEDVGV
jgi:hypothetical protein